MLSLSSCTFFTSVPADHPTVVNPVINKANKLLDSNDDQALQYLDSAFKKLTLPGPGDLYSLYEFKQAYYTNSAIDYNKTNEYADSMITVLLPFATNKQYNFRYAIALLKKGDALFYKKQYTEAYTAFYRARASILPDNVREHARFFFEYNRRLADISYGKRLFADAAFWHYKALKDLDAVTDTNMFYTRQGCLNNLGLSYAMAGRLDSAEKYYNIALNLIDSFKPTDSHQQKDKKLARGIVLGNLGTVYFKQGKMPLAEKTFKESISINAQPGYANEDAQLTRIKLAELYTKIEKLQEATVIKKEIESSADTLINTIDQLQLLIFQANYASATGDYAQANLAYRLYIKKMEELNMSKNSLMSSDFGSEFDLLQRQYDLMALKRQYQLNVIFLVGAIIVGIMAFCIAFLMYRSRLQDKVAALKLSRRYSQLEMTLAALEKSNQQNAQFHRVLAHDLKNPISAIYSITQLMSDDTTRSDDDKELIELMQLSSKNAINLIHDQLIEKGGTAVQGQAKMPFELSELLQESVSLLRYKAEEKHQRIFMVPPVGPAMVSIYREGIWRVLNNLIVNAIKFSKEEQVIEVGYDIQDGEVVVFVKDRGIGIPEVIKANLFLLSSEIKRKGTAGEESFGLGLYTSRQIIEDHGGKLWHEDNEPQGSVFRFSVGVVG